MGPNANETLLDAILYILHPLTIVSKQGFVFLAEYFEFFIRRPSSQKLPKILPNLNLSENFCWGSELNGCGRVKKLFSVSLVQFYDYWGPIKVIFYYFSSTKIAIFRLFFTINGDKFLQNLCKINYNP